MTGNGQYVYAVAQNDGIYRSINFGTTFSSCYSNGIAWFSVAASRFAGYAFAGVNGGSIYGSSDYGVTWTIAFATSDSYTSLAISDTGQYVYDSTGSIVLRSSDYGVTWSTVRSGSCNYVTCSSDGSILYLSRIYGYIYKSTNYGSAWTTLTSSGTPAWGIIRTSSTGVYIYAILTGFQDQVYYSGDSGATWTALGGSVSITYSALAVSGDGSTIYGAGNPSVIYSSTNYGSTWGTSYSSYYSWGALGTSSTGDLIVAGRYGGALYDLNYLPTYQPTLAPTAKPSFPTSQPSTQPTSNPSTNPIHYVTNIVVTSFVGNGGTGTVADGAASSVRFNNPRGICIDSVYFFMYVMDYGNNVVRKIDMTNGNTVSLTGTYLVLKIV